MTSCKNHRRGSIGARCTNGTVISSRSKTRVLLVVVSGAMAMAAVTAVVVSS